MASRGGYRRTKSQKSQADSRIPLVRGSNNSVLSAQTNCVWECAIQAPKKKERAQRKIPLPPLKQKAAKAQWRTSKAQLRPKTILR
jgi:hypothetical protein